MTPPPPPRMDEDADEELDVSALVAFGASCRAFDGYHAKSDVAMATVPHWYAMCVKDERVQMGEAATAATRAATSGRLRAFLDGGFAHPSARAMAPSAGAKRRRSGSRARTRAAGRFRTARAASS